MSGTLWPWAALALLGAIHGLNPGMGWLFAVALGLQERDRRAVWRAMLPMAAGHAGAIAAAVLAAAALGLAVPPAALRWLVAAVLLGFGAGRLVQHRHARWVAMRVSSWDLVLWSFLMASAHGAGLMALPLVLGSTAAASAHHHHWLAAGVAPAGVDVGLTAMLVHTAGYLAVTALLAALVYERFGLRILRSAWINLDRLWAVALVVTAVLTAATAPL